MRKPHFPQLLRLPVMGALVAATATALAAGPATAGQGFGPHIGSPHIGSPNTDAGNWAGYAATGGSGKFTSITGSWTEPVATCSGGALAAPWIGLDGDGSQTVEQTGAAVQCSGGSPHYKAWYEMYPRSPVYFSNPISGGDTFNASVTSEGGGKYRLSITDVTKGWTQAETKLLSSARNVSAEAILEGPGGFPNFPNGVTFTSVTVNGNKFSSYSPHRLSAIGSGGNWVPGPLNTNTGGFTITHQ